MIKRFTRRYLIRGTAIGVGLVAAGPLLAPVVKPRPPQPSPPRQQQLLPRW